MSKSSTCSSTLYLAGSLNFVSYCAWRHVESGLWTLGWQYNKSKESILCRTKIYRCKLTITINSLSFLLHPLSHPTITHDVPPRSRGLDQRAGFCAGFATALSSASRQPPPQILPLHLPQISNQSSVVLKSISRSLLVPLQPETKLLPLLVIFCYV